MRDVLSASHRPILAEFARARVLLGFDFDGTLAPIVSDPGRAKMRATTARLFEEISRRYPCVVISGRSRADVAGRLPKAASVTVVGNHGIEAREVPEGLPGEVARWRPILEKELAGIAGVLVEHKGCSISIHYRRSRRKEMARAAIRDAIRKLGNVTVIGGLQVVNVLPPGAPRKGAAFHGECERLDCDAAVFVGDDETDEDVFALDPPPRLLGVRVGARSGSAAAGFLSGQARIDELLSTFLALRQGGAPADSRRGS